MMKSKHKLSAFVLCVILTAAVIFSSVPVTAASGSLWYDKYVTLENSIGGNSYQSTYSDALAWGESYLLESYLTMYELTGNTQWLDKLVTHTDTIIGNATDPDGDGYLGWNTGSYSRVLTQNPGFETAASGDSTMAANWSRWQSTSTTAYRCVSPVADGTYSFAIKPNGTSWQTIYQNISSYVPGALMNFNVTACTSSQAKGRAFIKDMTTDTVIADILVDSSSWKGQSVRFNAPSESGHQLRIYLTHQDYRFTDGFTAFDNVNVSRCYEYIVHDGILCKPMAEFAKLVNGTPSLQAAYQTKANTYRNFLEANIIPKWTSSSYYGNCWVSSGSAEGYYRLPPNQDTLDSVYGPGDTVPFNMMLPFADMLLNLYDINGNSSYLDKAARVAAFFKNRLTLNGSAYKWNYGTLASTPEDTSHGMFDIGAAISFFRHNSLVMNGTDMERFTSTLVDKMRKGSATAPAVTRYVDGTGSTTMYTRNLANWIELSQFNIDVWSIAAEQFRNYTPVGTVDLLILSQIMKWDPQRVVNQGFELKTSFDPTQPARWGRTAGATSASVYLDSIDRYEGDYSTAVVSNGSTNNCLFASLKDRPGTATLYTCEFFGKADGSAAGGRVEIRNDTTGVVLGYAEFTGISWAKYSFTFTSPSNATDDMRIYIKNKVPAQTSGKANVDNVRVIKNGDPF